MLIENTVLSERKSKGAGKAFLVKTENKIFLQTIMTL